MSRQKKEHTLLNIRLDKYISDRLVAFCDDSGQTKTTAVERALIVYLDEYDRQKAILEEAEAEK